MYNIFQRSMKPINLCSKTLQNLSLLQHKPIKESITGRHLRATAEFVERLTRDYQKPDFDIQDTVINGRKVQVEEKVVMSKPFCDLVHFKRKGNFKHPRLLMVAPMAGHFASLLRDTIRQFLPDHDVYITDYKSARDVPLEEGGFGLDDFVQYITDFLRAIGPHPHLLSACQPCPGALVATAVLAMQDDPAQPKSLTLMAGPVDSRVNAHPLMKYSDKINPALLEKLVIDKVPARYEGRGRRVYGGFRQLSFFMSLNVGLHLKKHLTFYLDLIKENYDEAETHRRFYDDYMAVMDSDFEFCHDTLQRIFFEHHLPRGIMQYRGDTVDLGAIRKTALMTVEGEKDEFCPPGQTKAAHDLCPNVPGEMREYYLQEGVGHYGVFSGSKFRKSIAPRIKTFIQTSESGKA